MAETVGNYQIARRWQHTFLLNSVVKVDFTITGTGRIEYILEITTTVVWVIQLAFHSNSKKNCNFLHFKYIPAEH